MIIGTFKDFYTLYAEAFLPEGDSTVKYLYKNAENVYELSDDIRVNDCENGVSPIGMFTFLPSSKTKITTIDNLSIPNVYSALQYAQFTKEQGVKGDILKLFRYKVDQITTQSRRGGPGQAQEMSDDAVKRTANIINRLQPEVIYKVASEAQFNNDVIEKLNYKPRPRVIDLQKRNVSYFADLALDSKWVMDRLMGNVTDKITNETRRVVRVIARAYFQYLAAVKEGDKPDIPVSIDKIAVEIASITKSDGFITGEDGLSQNQISKEVQDPRGVKMYLRPNNFYIFDGLDIQNIDCAVLDDNLNQGYTFLEIGKRLQARGVDSRNLKYVVGVLWEKIATDPCAAVITQDARNQAAEAERQTAEAERRLQVKTAAKKADIIKGLRMRSTAISFKALVDLCAKETERKPFEIVRPIMQNKDLALLFSSDKLLTGRSAAEIAEYIFTRI